MSRVIAVKQGPERRVIRAGMRGRVGPTITAASVGADGHLILTLEGGTQLDAGVIDRPWGTILGDITQQLDLMERFGLKVNQDTYSAFVVATDNALGDRYTKTESDGRYDAAGTASGAVATHEALPDPHPQYTTAAEAAAAAPVQTVDGATGDVNLSGSYDALGSAATRIPLDQKAVADGVATLDANAKVPLNQINDAILGQMSYQGLWDASTNTPTLPGTPAQKGDYYIASAPGTQFGITFATGDWLVANDDEWGKVDNTDAVSTVQGRTGNVVITKADLDIEETYTLAEKNKLAGIAAGATANATDAQLRDRATHTGTQAIATVDGLQAALDALAQADSDLERRLTYGAYTQ